MFAGEALCAIVYVAMQVYRAKCRPAGYDNRYQRISIEDHDDSDDDDERDKHKLAINVTTADEKNAPAEVCNSEGVLCRACRLLLTDHVVSTQQDPWYAPFYFLLTCCFDVIGTTLGGIGLLVSGPNNLSDR
jgi:hypothetical protein